MHGLRSHLDIEHLQIWGDKRDYYSVLISDLEWVSSRWRPTPEYVPVPPPATQNFGFNPNLAPVAILPMLLDTVVSLVA